MAEEILANKPQAAPAGAGPTPAVTAPASSPCLVTAVVVPGQPSTYKASPGTITNSQGTAQSAAFSASGHALNSVTATEWAGEYESQKSAGKRMALVIPIKVTVIFPILYTKFRSLEEGAAHPGQRRLGVHRRSAGAVAHRNQLLRLLGRGLPGAVRRFGTSRGHRAEYFNQLRARRKGMEETSHEHIVDAVIEGAVLRLRPIMMTMLVATLGLLAAALSHAIGTDSQRPFAIVIVGGLLANLVIGVCLLPTFCVWVTRDHDSLPAVEMIEEY